MGWLDLLPGFGSHPASQEFDSEELDREASRLAEEAIGESVTVAVLTNETGRSDYPILAYLEDDERPQYVLQGTELLISDADGSVARKHPTRKLQVVVSDRRFLFVVGDRRSDDLWEVRYENVTDLYVDDDDWRRYVVVEADRDDAEMTFFADVTLEERAADVDAAVEHASDARSGRA